MRGETYTHIMKRWVECTRPFPRTQEEYKNFESKIIGNLNQQKMNFYILKGELSEEITGPFEFGKFREIEKHTKISLRPEEYKNEEYEAIVEGNKMLLNGATPLEVFKHNVEKVRYSHNYDGMKKIYENLQQEKKKETHRFWRPVTFYLFGPGGSEKTGLVQELFSDELYDKPKKQQSGSNWWNGYEGQEIVLIDEFYTKIDWGDMINILNDSCFNVEKKHSGFEPFIAKYVFLTATKPPEEAYNFNQTGVTEDDNKRDYEQFDRRLDYIIEFQGKWHDDISQRTTWIIFHKGNEEKFRNMEWDIKYCSSSNSID
ncbi:5421_t:CDS:2 [Gigaspora rosea]|nr:5421_t:CDS:2 [Gigaspora rosea]